ncbi:uncharacterized protein PRCAT00006058001 [Priceomyces carsonii]|uniref:uncharacterized protein n=1 Tax=Priceomyces carsonii TaxID=28549 RepID=UPI002ED7F216|nr:unnamed protein product [Priceomyces carsonii]
MPESNHERSQQYPETLKTQFSTSLLNPNQQIDSVEKKDNEDLRLRPEKTKFSQNMSTANTSEGQSCETSDDSLGSSVDFRGGQRIKLTSHEVKLILYLIVEVKPFKYIGKRSVSQSKKWELIQKEFSDTFKEKSNERNVVPTVRTLQRQLANAIKNAKKKRENRVNKSEKSHEEDLGIILNSLTRESSKSDLENAILMLNELSENIKTGKGVSLISSDSHDKNNSTLASPKNYVVHNMRDHTTNSPVDLVFRKVEETRTQINSLMSQLASEGTKTGDHRKPQLIELLDTLLQDNIKFQQTNETENKRLIQSTQDIIRHQLNECCNILEANNRFQAEQHEQNNQLLRELLSRIKDIDGNKTLRDDTIPGNTLNSILLSLVTDK